MKSLVELRKQHIQWTIDQDPTVITISRKGKIRSGGGFVEMNDEIGPLTVRVFQSNNQSVNEISELVGTKQLSSSWSMVANAQVELDSGPQITSTFSTPKLGDFSIVGVIPQIVRGEVVGYHVELERVI